MEMCSISLYPQHVRSPDLRPNHDAVVELELLIRFQCENLRRENRWTHKSHLFRVHDVPGRVLTRIRGIAEDRDPGAINDFDIEKRLFTRDLPDPDLLIRTSGEMRVSNFLLWQIAYSEIYVTDVLWPDFRRGSLFEAIIDYQTRERRYGDVKPNPENSLIAATVK